MAKTDSDAINFAKKDTKVNLFEIYVVEKAPEEEKVMILDIGALDSLEGRPWLQRYLGEFGYEIEDVVSLECYQVFQF